MDNEGWTAQHCTGGNAAQFAEWERRGRRGPGDVTVECAGGRIGGRGQGDAFGGGVGWWSGALASGGGWSVGKPRWRLGKTPGQGNIQYPFLYCIIQKKPLSSPMVVVICR